MDLRQSEHLKYLVASDYDYSWGLVATTVGFQNAPPHSRYPPKNHPAPYLFNPDKGRTLHEYQVMYVVKGEGRFMSASCKSSRVAEGSLMILFPEEWHSFQPEKETGWQIYWLGFDGKQAKTCLKHPFFSRKNAVIDIGLNEQVVSLFEQAIKIASFQKTGHQQMLAGITHHLLSVIFYAEKNNSFKDEKIVQQIEKAKIIMIGSTFSNRHADEIAKELHLSYSWFRRVFKQYTGFSPAQYQLEVKMQKARELLTSTSMTMNEIADELGFRSVSYFVSFFKKKSGISPRSYRIRAHAKPEA